MLQNAYFLAKIGADTAENEQHFAEILPIGRRVADRGEHVAAAASVARPAFGWRSASTWARGLEAHDSGAREIIFQATHPYLLETFANFKS